MQTVNRLGKPTNSRDQVQSHDLMCGKFHKDAGTTKPVG